MKSHFAGTLFRLPFRTKKKLPKTALFPNWCSQRSTRKNCARSLRRRRGSGCSSRRRSDTSGYASGRSKQGDLGKAMDFYSKAENVQDGKSRNAIIWQNPWSHGQACDWTITSALPAMCVCNYSVCIYSVCACCLCVQLLCVQLLCMRLWRSSQTICISTVVFYDCAHNRKRRDRFCGSLRQALLGLRL